MKTSEMMTEWDRNKGKILVRPDKTLQFDVLEQWNINILLFADWEVKVVTEERAYTTEEMITEYKKDNSVLVKPTMVVERGFHPLAFWNIATHVNSKWEIEKKREKEVTLTEKALRQHLSDVAKSKYPGSVIDAICIGYFEV